MSANFSSHQRRSGPRTTPADPEQRPPAPRLVPSPARFAWTPRSPFMDAFELTGTAGRPLARLTVGGLTYPAATVETEGHRFLLTANGVGNRRVAVTDAATDLRVADFEWRRRGRTGTVRLVRGGQLRWRRTGWWRPSFTIADRFGNVLLRFDPDGRVLGDGLNARHEPPLGSRADLALLLALGWFLLLCSGAAVGSSPPAPGPGGRR
jgi:hypothetical protein